MQPGELCFLPPSDYTLFRELDQIISKLPSQLLQAAQAFRQNIRAIRSSAGLPFYIAVSGVQSRHFTLTHISERIRALPLSGPLELDIEAEKRALESASAAFTQQASNKRWRASTAAEAISFADKVLHGDDTRPAGAELLRQCAVLCWAALEVVANDLFVSFLNTRPELSRKLLQDERTGKRFQLKDPTRLIDEFGYDFSVRMGDILSFSCKLDDAQILREVFDVIFPTNNQLRALLLSTELWLLYQRRNLIVHRLGIVDKSYLASTGDEIELGEELFISPDKLNQYLLLIRDIGTELLRSATEVIGRDTSPHA